MKCQVDREFSESGLALVCICGFAVDLTKDEQANRQIFNEHLAGEPMTLETLSDMLKACPHKSLSIQFESSSKRFVICVESDQGDEELTRSASLVNGLQVASEALVADDAEVS